MSVVSQGYGDLTASLTPTNAYPTWEAVEAYYSGAGLSVGPHLDFRRTLSAAINRFERETNRKGLYSYASNCPDDVYIAIVCLAVSMLVPATNITTNVSKVKQDDVEVTYVAGNTQQAQWGDLYSTVVALHKRMVFA